MAFSGKVAIVTGAASGIGAATAKALGREGAKIVLVDKEKDKLEEVLRQCKQHGKNAIAVNADVTKDEDIRNIIKETINTFDQLDILVNNAGTVRNTCILDEDIMNNYDLIMNTNLRAMVYLTHLAAPYLIKTKGNIINTSSVVDGRVSENHLCYCVSKAGVGHFTRCVALDLAPHEVRVNAVRPGPTNTNIAINIGFPSLEPFKDTTALDKISEPEEIADLIIFLASDKAKSVTGSSYICDNGWLLK